MEVGWRRERSTGDCRSDQENIRSVELSEKEWVSSRREDVPITRGVFVVSVKNKQPSVSFCFSS